MKLSNMTQCQLLDINVPEDMPYFDYFKMSQDKVKSMDYSVFDYLTWLDFRMKEYGKCVKTNIGQLYISFETFLELRYPFDN